jgi:hypothetical protein
MLLLSHEVDYCLDQSVYVWPSSSACFSAIASDEWFKHYCKDAKSQREDEAKGHFLTGLLAQRLGNVVCCTHAVMGVSRVAIL